MAALSAVYPLVQLDCPGVPHPVMDDAIRRGAREFCKLTHAITSDVTITTAVGTPDYTPTLTAGTEVVAILSIKRAADESLTPKSQDYIDSLEAEAGEATIYALLETYPLSIRFHKTPDTIESLTAKLVLMPTQTATTINDRLADWYLEGVTAYAKYWLMSQVGKPWTNPESAAFANRQFIAQVADTKVRRSQWRADLPAQVEMRPFA